MKVIILKDSEVNKEERKMVKKKIRLLRRLVSWLYFHLSGRCSVLRKPEDRFLKCYGLHFHSQLGSVFS